MSFPKTKIYHGSPNSPGEFGRKIREESYLTNDPVIALAFGKMKTRSSVIYLYEFELDEDSFRYDGKEEGEDYWRYMSQKEVEWGSFQKFQI